MMQKSISYVIGGLIVEVRIMYSAGLFFLGWLWFYLFLRQFLFNFLTALPLIKKMRSLQEDMIAVGAVRYTVISIVVCIVISAIIIALVLWLCPLIMKIAFAVGAAMGLIMYANKLTPANRAMFDTFCAGYYRFVPDDELRTAMFNKKTGQMKVRLRDMGITGTFIPEFKK